MDAPRSLADVDPADARKARGAFFTPDEIARYMTEWAILSPDDRVMEPSVGDAAFLIPAVRRLAALGAERPEVWGSEIHAASAAEAERRIRMHGGVPRISVEDFFSRAPDHSFDAVVGNPPYIRYQDFAGAARDRSRLVARRAGVVLSGLASSWAAFTVHAAQCLKPGGRLAFVLPAELLSVNYAGPVREFLLKEFGHVEIIVFDEQVFPEAETDVVLLLASSYGGRSTTIDLRPVRNANELPPPAKARTWTPATPDGKWIGALGDDVAQFELASLAAQGDLVPLQEWGETTLGAVTGSNAFFALSPARVRALGIPRHELVRISPPGSGHLRGLELTSADLRRLGREGRSTWLFRPGSRPSPASATYIEHGRVSGISTAYKCRMRRTWYQVPLVEAPDLFLTYMNADTVRVTTNTAGARHLNSVHGVVLREELRALGRDLLPLASLNSATAYSAELVGRSYGGGILKMEPREADSWLMPSPALVRAHADALRAVRTDVLDRLDARDLLGAIRIVDRILFGDASNLLAAHEAARLRRSVRGRSG